MDVAQTASAWESLLLICPSPGRGFWLFWVLALAHSCCGHSGMCLHVGTCCHFSPMKPGSPKEAAQLPEWLGLRVISEGGSFTPSPALTVASLCVFWSLQMYGRWKDERDSRCPGAASRKGSSRQIQAFQKILRLTGAHGEACARG